MQEWARELFMWADYSRKIEEAQNYFKRSESK